MSTVCCYYENIGSEKFQRETIRLWAKSWSQSGWSPVVLGIREAASHPVHDEFVRVVSKYPTINDPRYELACYRRYLAMVTTGGGLHTDYDVINNGFKPQDMPPIEDTLQTLDSWGTPCAAFGSKLAWEKAIGTLCGYKPQAGKHTSDMTILDEMTPLRRHNVSQDFGAEGWQSCKLIHFLNDRVFRFGAGKNRNQIICNIVDGGHESVSRNDG